MATGISVYSELTDGSRLAIVVDDSEHPVKYGSKLRTCGEHHLLLTVDGKLYLAEYRNRERTVELQFLRENVSDFDTEGNFIYFVCKAEGKVFQGKNGSIGEWMQLFDESEIRFEKICCNNNGLLLTSAEGSKLYAKGDFGNLLNFENLSPVEDISSETVVQISAGIDFVILSSQKTTKVFADVKKDPFYNRLCLDETNKQRYVDWRNVFADSEYSFDRKVAQADSLYNSSIDSLIVYGQMIHETGVASFGKINKGQLGTGDHIRRDKIISLELFDVAKIATCCDYSSALTVEGNLFLWGDTNKNQASLDTNLTLCSASTPTLLNRFKHIMDVSSGLFQTYVLTNDLRIHDVKSDESSLNYECGDRKRLSHLFVGEEVRNLEDVPLILASDSLILVNHLPINREAMRIYTNEQSTIQCLLKHFKEHNLSGILRKTSNTISPHFFYRSCTRLFYMLLLNLKSLRKYLLENDLTKIVSLLMHEELHYLYRLILKCYCDSDCLGLMREPEQKLLQIYLDNVQNKIDIIEILVNTNKSLSETVETRLLNIKSEWLKFINEEVSEEMGKLTKTTKEFWLREDNIRWCPLKEAHRRVILDSSDVPLKLLEVNIFSSSPRIVLFSDMLCYLVGSQIITYPLELVWISTEITDTVKNRHKEKLRFMINIITPEEVLRCYTLDSADKLLWLNSLKTHVMRNLKMDPTAKQPVYRFSPYQFGEKHTKYGRMKYEGIWKVGQIDGIGELTGSDQTYKGELYHGDITGFGCMSKTQYDITTVYEDTLSARNFDILALQEVCWKGSTVPLFRGGYTIYHSCSYTRAQGTAFSIIEKMQNRVIG